MKNWFDIAIPHEDIRKGDFDEAVFAADLGDVAAGRAAADYNDPYTFFKKTYLTHGLENLLQQVHKKLTTGQGPSVLELQTPFGGGKTHALVLIYHYLTNGQRVRELLPEDVDLVEPALSAIVGTQLNVSQGVTSEGVTRHTLWGEMAFQLAGREGYGLLEANDRERTAPGKATLRDLLEQHQPFVLLFDEVLEYVVKGRGVEVVEGDLGAQTLSFFQELTEAVASLQRGLMLVTLPSSELEDFGEKEERNLIQLEHVFHRLKTVVTPVQGEEIYSIIRRRLFEPVRDEALVRAVVDRYAEKYHQYREELPPKAREGDYRRRLEKAYPFHPDVIDILYEKWGTFSTFQRTRGVLRLLANVVEDLYQRESNLDLILPGDVNLAKGKIRQEFISHIGAIYESVIGSDVADGQAKAQIMDRANKSWKHLAERIGTAVFLHSFAADDSEKGADLSYIKLATVRPETVTPLVTEVLQKLSNELWYLNTRGERYYFSDVPNLNRMIIDRKEVIDEGDVRDELRRRIKRELGTRFRTYFWPEASDELPDNTDLKLAVMEPGETPPLEQLAQWVNKRGEGFRTYKNTLFFALSDAGRHARMADEIREFLALRAIQQEIARDERPGLREKVTDIKRRLQELEDEFPLRVRELYRTGAVPMSDGGLERMDLGQPSYGRENLDTWYWKEMAERGRIMTNPPSTNILRHKFLANQDAVSLHTILEQFYKDPGMQVPGDQDTVAQAVARDVQDGALGLVRGAGADDLDPQSLRFNIPMQAGEVHFNEDVFLIGPELAQDLQTQAAEAVTGGETTAEAPGAAGTGLDVEPGTPGEMEATAPTTTDADEGPETVKQFSFRASGISTGRLADLSRGVFLPLSREVGAFTFSIEVDVRSADGISKKVIEQQVIETLRQLGAEFEVGDET